MRRMQAAILVVATAALFGFLGLATRRLGDLGFSSLDIAIYRATIATIGLFIVIMIFDRKSLLISRRAFAILIIFGLAKLGSDVCLFTAQANGPLAMATLLQMTAPYYVLVFSLVLFKEKITLRRIGLMFTASLGCIMVTGVLSGSLNATTLGVFAGLLSGLFYGIHSMSGRIGRDLEIKPHIIVFYVFLICDISAIALHSLTGDVMHTFSGFLNPDALPVIVILGTVLTLIPFYFFAYTAKVLEASTISILGIAELVASTLVGAVFFNEILSFGNTVGMIIVIASIVFMNTHISRKVKERRAQKTAAAASQVHHP